MNKRQRKKAVKKAVNCMMSFYNLMKPYMDIESRIAKSMKDYIEKGEEYR